MDTKVSVRVVTNSGFVLIGTTLVSGSCAVLVGTGAGTKVVDVELSMATDGIACALAFGWLVPASEMGGTGLMVFWGCKVLKVIGMTTGMVADVTLDPFPAPAPAMEGEIEVGMTAAEGRCEVRTVVVVDGLDVGTTTVEGALYPVVVGTMLVGGIAGTESLCTVPAAADVAVEKPEISGTAGTDEE